MELESMFVDQKWNILHHLATGDYSPMQLAEKTNTTISNMSQQLRLLEAAKLVQKKKISNRDKGKPRAIFSLSSDYAYLISVTKDFTSKKFFTLTNYHKTILKIWSIENLELHPIIADIYRLLISKIESFECVYLTEKNQQVTLNMVFNGNKDAQKLASLISSQFGGANKNFSVAQIKPESFKKKIIDVFENAIVLHDPNNMFTNNTHLLNKVELN